VLNNRGRVGATDLLPAVVLVAVAVLDRLVAKEETLAALVIIAPLLASSLTSVRVTVAYGILAVATWAVLDVAGAHFATASNRSAEFTRLAGILLATAVAVSACATRVRREELLRRVERVADAAQRAILPQLPPKIGAVHIAARYESSTQDATVGGDFYAAMPTRFGVRVLLGDVRGSGLSAVGLAGTVLGSFRERAEEEQDLVRLLNRLDAAVRRVAQPEDFVTSIVLQVTDTGTATIVNAGHPPPILFRGHSARILSPTTSRPPLGLSGSAPATAEVLEVGDRLLLYTDGATEARRLHDRAFRGTDGIISDALPAATAAQTVERIFTGVLSWSDGKLTDDVAVVCVAFQPQDVRLPHDSVGSRSGGLGAQW
jgi:phosphoserine phosphatase RsbU/P